MIKAPDPDGPGFPFEHPSKYYIHDKIECNIIFIFNSIMPKSSNKSKQRTYKEFEDEIKSIQNTELPKSPKTNYCGLLGTKEGFEILKKMSWVEIEELTDYEFFGE